MAKPICGACGSDMKRTNVARSGCLGQLLGVVTLTVAALLSLLLFPIGLVPGLVLLYVAVRLCGSRRVLKCRSCGALIERA